VTGDEARDRRVICWWAAIIRQDTSSNQARSIRRADRTPRDQHYNSNTIIIDGS
jgi:hypothetical protein